MTDSIIEKAKAAVHMARLCKSIIATGDPLHLYYLAKEAEELDENICCVRSRYSKNRIMIKMV